MENKNQTSKRETNEANIKLNQELVDNEVTSSFEGRPEAERANNALQEAFYHEKDDDINDLPPTYINNNTPAIKINEDAD
jgi:tyrosyl-tRNA synthetase